MLETNDIFWIEDISDGSLSLNLNSAYTKHIKMMNFFKKFILQYHYDRICIIKDSRYNMRIYCSQDISHSCILKLFEKAISIYKEDKESLTEHILLKLTDDDKSFLSSLELKIG